MSLLCAVENVSVSFVDGTGTGFLCSLDLLKYSYGSVQFDVDPQSEAGQQLRALRDEIPDEDLMAKGRTPDENLHVTLRYGIEDSESETRIAAFLAEQAPFTITLGKTMVFAADGSIAKAVGAEGAAIVVVDVESPELVLLNAALAEHGAFTVEDFKYQPHLTLAYIDPAAADQWIGEDSVAGLTLQVDSLTISSKDGTKTKVMLTGPTGVEKFNPNHGQDGRFSEGLSGSKTYSPASITVEQAMSNHEAAADSAYRKLLGNGDSIIGDQVAGTTKELKTALHYQDEGWRGMNASLRGETTRQGGGSYKAGPDGKSVWTPKPPVKVTASQAASEAAHVERLQSLISKQSLPEGITVFHGPRITQGELNSIKVGDVITKRGFFSTSTSPSIASEFGALSPMSDDPKVIFAIDVPKGHSGLALRGDENEIVFNPKTQLRVKSIEKHSDGKVIHASI
jgi:2'-5' RNA ligase